MEITLAVFGEYSAAVFYAARYFVGRGFNLKDIKRVCSLNEAEAFIKNVGTDIIFICSDGELNEWLKKSLSFDGASYKYNQKRIFTLFTGKEMRENLTAILKAYSPEGVISFKLFGAKPKKLSAFFKNRGREAKIYDFDGDITLRISEAGLDEMQKAVLLKEFVTEFSDFIYAEDEITLEEQLVRILKTRGVKISVAESFTGGRISAAITSVPGASAVFYEGAVTYNENAKIARLGVKPVTIERCFPVSAQTAYEMADGLIKDGNSFIALSATGLAGPASDSSGYKVGLCYIGVATEERTVVFKYCFSGGREEITEKGVNTALFVAVKTLRKGIFNL